MRFSYSAVWNETLAILRSHASLLIAIAGVFMFLPSVLSGYLIPPPQGGDESRAVQELVGWFSANWPWLLLVNIVSMIGTIAIFQLIFDRGRPTVGGAIAGAFLLLPAYLLASIIIGFLTAIGLILLIIPGLYIFARFTPFGPVIVAERRGPIDAIGRTFAVTRGKGWAILGLVIVIVLAGAVINIALTAVVGSILLLVGGQDLGKLLALLFESALGTIFAIVMLALFAAIYRACVGEGSGD